MVANFRRTSLTLEASGVWQMVSGRFRLFGSVIDCSNG